MVTTNGAKHDVDFFKQRLGADKLAIDADIGSYATSWVSGLREQFGEHAAEAVEAYCALLARGGKRIRGALAMQAYRAFGGTHERDSLVVARVLEMIHAYLLVLDDIQDHSDMRRGGPTTHKILESYHTSRSLRGDTAHFGMSQATNATLAACHTALNQLLDLSSPQKIEALRHLNDTLVATAMGQFYDMYNEVSETVDEQLVFNALLWKTAYYTVSNPLYIGALLAGAHKVQLELLAEFGLKAGLAFQMSDDILGTFSSKDETGKPPMDDIREGKRTLLVLKTLALADKADALFLEQMLGNQHLSHAQFEHCKRIITGSGARAECQRILEQSCTEARALIDSADLPGDLSPYLCGLVEYLRTRKS